MSSDTFDLQARGLPLRQQNLSHLAQQTFGTLPYIYRRELFSNSRAVPIGVAAAAISTRLTCLLAEILVPIVLSPEQLTPFCCGIIVVRKCWKVIVGSTVMGLVVKCQQIKDIQAIHCTCSWSLKYVSRFNPIYFVMFSWRSGILTEVHASLLSWWKCLTVIWDWFCQKKKKKPPLTMER